MMIMMTVTCTVTCIITWYQPRRGSELRECSSSNSLPSGDKTLANSFRACRGFGNTHILKVSTTQSKLLSPNGSLSTSPAGQPEVCIRPRASPTHEHNTANLVGGMLYWRSVRAATLNMASTTGVLCILVYMHMSMCEEGGVPPENGVWHPCWHGINNQSLQTAAWLIDQSAITFVSCLLY